MRFPPFDRAARILGRAKKTNKQTNKKRSGWGGGGGGGVREGGERRERKLRSKHFCCFCFTENEFGSIKAASLRTARAYFTSTSTR